jgi:hypothetical protein
MVLCPHLETGSHPSYSLHGSYGRLQEPVTAQMLVEFTAPFETSRSRTEFTGSSQWTPLGATRIQFTVRIVLYVARPQSKFPTRPTPSKPYIARSDCAYMIEQCCSMAHALTLLPAFSQ